MGGPDLLQPWSLPAEGAGVKGRGSGRWAELPSDPGSSIYLMWGLSFLICKLRMVLVTSQDYWETCDNFAGGWSFQLTTWLLVSCKQYLPPGPVRLTLG